MLFMTFLSGFGNREMHEDWRCNNAISLLCYQSADVISEQMVSFSIIISWFIATFYSVNKIIKEK